jgi:hypothetical protein
MTNDTTQTAGQPMTQHDAAKFQHWQNLCGNIIAMQAAADTNDAPHLINCLANPSWAMASASDLPEPPPEEVPAP